MIYSRKERSAIRFCQLALGIEIEHLAAAVSAELTEHDSKSARSCASAPPSLSLSLSLSPKALADRWTTARSLKDQASRGKSSCQTTRSEEPPRHHSHTQHGRENRSSTKIQSGQRNSVLATPQEPARVANSTAEFARSFFALCACRGKLS